MPPRRRARLIVEGGSAATTGAIASGGDAVVKRNPSIPVGLGGVTASLADASAP
eukprot:CAMPEP_0115866336 /NCGR_PEP_ID=MMETSP0287-20121206/20195_1 /TAXON_ID=412157 /ORGANISM="Chrysochromulina rotalis, Strain UIO044" /LENGTH=53 /DNA_ID=CAMNT_0003320897 /DNA_START=348 /DNA_END=505 /DNA_ORIENTATION=-